MSTNRTRRSRLRTEPAVITALRTGAAVEWSPENWETLIAGRYFGDYGLSAEESDRAAELLSAWQEQQLAAERAGRH